MNSILQKVIRLFWSNKMKNIVEGIKPEQAPNSYTPSIEEFHIGFEFEAFNNADWYWQEDTSGWKAIKRDEYNAMMMHTSQILGAISKGWIRVKCLDQEDIESCDFIERREEGDCISWYRCEGSLQLVENTYGNRVEIAVCGSMRVPIFNGIIKNKSELKRTLKQLGYGVE